MTVDGWLLLVSLLLVLLSGLLVGVETAIARVSKARVEELRRDRPRRAERLLAIVEDRPRYVNVLLFLSTTSSVTATVFVSYVFLDLFTRDRGWPVAGSLLLAVAVMVVVSYVVLGVASRTLGRQHADGIAMAAAGPTRALGLLLSPLATLLIVIGNALTPGKGYREGPFASQAELRELVDLASDDQVIEAQERRMIHSVFELSDTVAREVMVPRTEVVFIERDKRLRQAISLGLRSGFSRIPVIGESSDDVVGVIYLKDAVRKAFEDRAAEDDPVESLMRPAYFVPDSKEADDLLRDMQAHRVHVAVVVDEYGGTAGLVTIEDILEEIVGEIADEHDTEAPEVIQLADEVYRVSSRMHVDDFADLVGVSVEGEEEGVDTVLGLMAKRLERVPIPGATVDVDGWTLIAERGQGRRNRIGTVLAKRRQEAGDDERE